MPTLNALRGLPTFVWETALSTALTETTPSFSSGSRVEFESASGARAVFTGDFTVVGGEILAGTILLVDAHQSGQLVGSLTGLLPLGIDAVAFFGAVDAFRGDGNFAPARDLLHAGGTTFKGSNDGDILSGGSDGDLFEPSNGPDFLVGFAGNDTLNGGGGADTLIGGDGDDTLDGGTNPTGATGNGDIMLGGPGSDLYYVDSGFDKIDEGALFPEWGGGGYDEVISSSFFFWDFSNVAERLSLTADASTVNDETGEDFGVSTLVGGGFDSDMIGNSGNNNIYTNWGNDTVWAGGGVDHVDFTDRGAGASGANTLVFDNGNGYDIIWQFVPGTDKVDVSRVGIANFDELMMHATEVTGGGAAPAVYFTLGDTGTDYLYILNVAKADLSSGDFIYAM